MYWKNPQSKSALSILHFKFFYMYELLCIRPPLCYDNTVNIKLISNVLSEWNRKHCFFLIKTYMYYSNYTIGKRVYKRTPPPPLSIVQTYPPCCSLYRLIYCPSHYPSYPNLAYPYFTPPITDVPALVLKINKIKFWSITQ